MPKVIICFIMFFKSIQIYPQELINDLKTNPYTYDIKKNVEKNSILSIPFIDDFSYDFSNVNNDLWEISSVFVNRSYPINPPTIGVATFDGLNQFGRPYSINSTIDGNADTLLSKAIDLSAINTAYFLFYYQPQGIGDMPQIEDSIILEFLDNNLNWNIIWKKEGTSSFDFKKKVFLINSSDYLHNNFRFRFRNKATLSGNFDHWNLDYVKLDEFNTSLDTSSLNDISFVYNISSYLRRYSQMPWSHFVNYENNELKDSINVFLRNNRSSINVGYQYDVYNKGSLVGHYPTLGNVRNETVLDYDSIGNFLFSSPPVSVSSSFFNSNEVDSVTFYIKHIISTSTSDLKNNDTLRTFQRFYSTFSYDDGSAESAYGINVNGAKIAYQFKLNHPDTLRAVQMFFPEMLDSVSNLFFELTIWDDFQGKPGNTLYSQDVNPFHTENGNFHTYELNSPLGLSGTFYVGWKQTTDDVLNLGLDKNIISNNYMFYNSGSGWNNSQFQGSWMIRPIVSTKEILLSNNLNRELVKIYPNPCSSKFTLNGIDNGILNIYSLQGKLIKNITIDSESQFIFIDDLVPSVYILHLSCELGYFVKKLIVK
tara:strand:+ start:767 stop:2551 length:1785 start_codon:yes stop_codon:yes gene_type:complete